MCRSPGRPLGGLRLPERNQRRLRRMDGQAEAGKPLGQHRHDLAGVRFQFAADDKVIGKADQEASSLQAWLYLLLKPFIQTDGGRYWPTRGK